MMRTPYRRPLLWCCLLLLAVGLMACSGSTATTPPETAPETQPTAPIEATTEPTAATDESGSEEMEATPEAAEGAGEMASEWTGTIVMFAQQYTPNAQDDETPLNALQEAADRYEEMHPGITIEFFDEQIQGYDDVVRANAAAGELWDLFWAQWGSLNGTLPKGIAYDLAPYFEAPNPYIEGNTRWADAMNETVIAETRAPTGESYNINGDFVATAFFYNQDLLAQAGVETIPTTWQELLDASAALQEAGIPAVVGVPYFGWWNRHFLSDFYAEDFETITSYDDQPGRSALDEACAINAGLLSTEDPRFVGWWPVMKEFTQYWVPDYIVREPDANSQAEQDFIGGAAAMYYSGSWFPNTLEGAGVTFPYASFNFPPLGTEVSEYSSGNDVSGAVGGPNAGFQYAISSPEANRTMEEPGKFEAVLDWLHFISVPETAEAIINEDGSYVPTWPDTSAPEGVETLAEQANQELRVIGVGSASAQLGDDMQRIFGLYLSDNITIEDAETQV